MTIKNNVTRLLDSRKIDYTPHVYPPDKMSGQEVADLLGVDPALVFKTIVIKRQQRGKHILAVVPSTGEVDLKAVAKAVGEKKVNLVTQKEAEQLTGLLTGGISPLALLSKSFEVVIDSSARSHANIFISGGQRGLNIQLAPQSLIDLVGAKISEISTKS